MLKKMARKLETPGIRMNPGVFVTWPVPPPPWIVPFVPLQVLHIKSGYMNSSQ